MAKNPSYRYFVEPLNPNADEMFAEYLTTLNGSSFDVEKRTIRVKGKPVYGVYLVIEHAIITKLSRSVHKRNVRVYVQEDEGEIRPYALYAKGGGSVSRTLAVKKAKQQIKDLPPQRI